MLKKDNYGRKLRHQRVREKIHGTPERPRLCVYISNRYIYAQAIDDTQGRTLHALSTLCKDMRSGVKGKTMREQAQILGEKLAVDLLEKGIQQVVFDRNGYKYGLRLKNLADKAREKGLKF